MGLFSKRKKDDVARLIMMAINIAYLTLGGILISVGINLTEMEDPRAQTDMVNDLLYVEVLGQVITFLGILTLVAGLAGIVAAIFKIRKALVFYVLILLVTAIILIGVGAALSLKTSDELKIGWDLSTQFGKAQRKQLLENFKCCGWILSTDSYNNEPSCLIDLEVYPETTPCRDAVQAYIEEVIYPNSTGAIGVGIFMLASVMVAMVMVFTSKNMRDEFYENPFHG